MKIEIGDKLAEALTQLAQKLGTTSEHLWEVLVRQAVISAVSEIAIFILFVFIFGLILKLTNKNFLKAAIEDKFHWHVPFWVISVVILFICVFVFAESGSKWISSFMNPEYFALKHILHYLS